MPPADPVSLPPRTVAVLGATGFVGRATARALVDAGHHVLAFTRRASQIDDLTRLGAEPVLIRAGQHTPWTGQLGESDLVLDLTQPALPERLTTHAAAGIAEQRVEFTRTLIRAIRRRPAAQRPLLITVSGTDDLQPDPTDVVHATSPLREHARGFGHIGIPVRREIEASDIDATFVYFGNVVLGPGKAFRDRLVPGVASGAVKVIGRGDNLLPITHIDDAAGALAHLAGVPRDQVAGQSLLASPAALTQRQLLDAVASSIGARRPGRVPTWIAALAIGRPQAEVMTLHADVDPTSMTRVGYRYLHRDPVQAVHDATAPLSVLI